MTTNQVGKNNSSVRRVMTHMLDVNPSELEFVPLSFDENKK